MGGGSGDVFRGNKRKQRGHQVVAPRFLFFLFGGGRGCCITEFEEEGEGIQRAVVKGRGVRKRWMECEDRERGNEMGGGRGGGASDAKNNTMAPT